MNTGATLLYTFFAILQIYIMFSVGIILAIKKKLSDSSIRTISQIIFIFFFPTFGIIEIARMASWPKVEILWYLMISSLISMVVAFFICKLVHIIFRLDVRISNTFSYVTCIPSLGAMSLVIGKALCYPGGMLEGDKYCDNILGFMMMHFLIFQIYVFTLGFTIFPYDLNIFNELNEKLSYTWHLLINNKDNKTFAKDYYVDCLFKKYFKDKTIAVQASQNFTSKYKLVTSFNKNTGYSYEYIKLKNSDQLKGEVTPTVQDLNINHIPINVELKFIKEDSKDKHGNYIDIKHIKQTNSDICLESEILVNNKNENIKTVTDIDLSKIPRDILLYYNKLFKTVRNNIDEFKIDEFYKEKETLLNNLTLPQPKFPFNADIQIDSKAKMEIESSCDIFSQNVKLIDKNFRLTTIKTKISMNFILSKLFSPPIVGCFLGILLGVSQMREIIFSKNIYIANILENIYLISKSLVPFLYTALGISMYSAKSVDLGKITITKNYIILAITIKFVIMPIIGMIYVYLWFNYYGGIVASSVVLKFCMFAPFSLPCAPTIIIVSNYISFFKGESSIILCITNLLSIIFMFVYLIFFILI